MLYLYNVMHIRTVASENFIPKFRRGLLRFVVGLIETEKKKSIDRVSTVKARVPKNRSLYILLCTYHVRAQSYACIQSVTKRQDSTSLDCSHVCSDVKTRTEAGNYARYTLDVDPNENRAFAIQACVQFTYSYIINMRLYVCTCAK